MTRRRRNPTVLRCSACGAECKRRVHGKWYAAEWVLWMAFGATILVPFARLPVALYIVLMTAAAYAFQTASRRLYHSYFAWRHPTRCQSGGLPEPETNRG